MDVLAVVGSILGGVILVGGAAKAAPSVWQFIKAAAKLPTMVESMFHEFSPNSGTSLRDKVDNLTEGQRQMLAWQDQHADEDTHTFENLAAQSKETNEYLHTRMHDVLNRLTPLVAWPPIFDKRLIAIETRLGTSETKAEGQAVAVNEHLDRVHDEVRTANALTVGELADADETRRIEAIPPADRTVADDEHVEAVPPIEE